MNNALSNYSIVTRAMVLISMLLIQPLVSAQDQSSSQEVEQLKLLQQQMMQGTAGAQPASDADTLHTVTTPTVAGQTTVNTVRTTQPGAAANTQVIINDMGQSKEEIINERAFDATKRRLFPLSTEQILDLKRESEEQDLAQNSSVGAPPRPIATSQLVNLSPGSTPPVIRLAQGFVSSVVFLDSTGAPWPITAYDLGDPAAFNIQWDRKSNTLMIQALKLYTYGNLAIRLKGLNTPVMITLIPGQKAVDYRVDMRIQGIGPNAQAMPMEGLPASASDILLHILDGVAPPGSDRLVVSGGDARAWLYGGKMYVRTNLTILSPGWIGSMTSADGMHAYEMLKSPVLLVSWHGKVMQLKIEGL